MKSMFGIINMLWQTHCHVGQKYAKWQNSTHKFQPRVKPTVLPLSHISHAVHRQKLGFSRVNRVNVRIRVRFTFSTVNLWLIRDGGNTVSFTQPRLWFRPDCNKLNPAHPNDQSHKTKNTAQTSAVVSKQEFFLVCQLFDSLQTLPVFVTRQHYSTDLPQLPVLYTPSS